MLGYSQVAPRDRTPDRWMLFLHGILGSRSNWRSVARRFVEARPDWGAVLVDLRKHGESQQASAPHTVGTAARDLDALEGEVSGPIRGVLGHSFGGKVALSWASERGRDVDEVWLVDAMPGARPDGRGSEHTLQVIGALEGLTFPMSSRNEFVTAMRDHGFDEGVAQWLAMNLEHTDQGGFELGLDLEAIRALLDDYFQRDLWNVIESPPEGPEIHLVVGGRSPVFDQQERRRAAAAAARHEHVHLHAIEDAGHWVHVEAPDALLELLGYDGEWK